MPWVERVAGSPYPQAHLACHCCAAAELRALDRYSALRVKPETQLREAILRTIDPRFASDGFDRRKNDFEWRRRISENLEHSVHLNFGRHGLSVSVNPSVGVRHEDVERILVQCSVRTTEAGAATFATMLTDLAGGRYEATVEEGPEAVGELIWADWCAAGRPFVEDVSTLSAAIRRLQSSEPHDWCCFGRALRARLLPASLAAAGRSHEAIASLESLRGDVAGRDQLLPSFADFEACFRRVIS